MNLPTGTALRVLKPLNGIPEAGLQWYLTYLSYHIEELGMIRSRTDPWLLIKRENGKLRGMIPIQVDESIGIGDQGLMEEEGKESNKLICKPRKVINKELDRVKRSACKTRERNSHHESDTKDRAIEGGDNTEGIINSKGPGPIRRRISKKGHLCGIPTDSFRKPTNNQRRL